MGPSLYLLALLALLLFVAGVVLLFRRARASVPAPVVKPSPPKITAPAEEVPDFEEPPSWANGYTTQQWTRLMNEIRACLKARGMEFVIAESGQIVMRTAGGEKRLGLLNLTQICRQVEPEKWAGVIGRHFDSIMQTEREVLELEGKIRDFEQVKTTLVVRLAPEDAMPPELLVARMDLPGTVSYLALDLPTSIRPLKPSEVAVWGKTNDELFELALENVVRLAKPEVSTPELEPGIACTALVGESFFVATHALLLDLHPECLGAHGSLVAVPHRHCVLAYPIEDLQVIQAIPRLAMIGRKLETEGPGSISPRLYWYHHGGFVVLPYEIKANTFNFSPPEDFVAVLNELGEAG